MTTRVWAAARSDVEAFLAGRHGDPFSFMGPHSVKGGHAVRVFVPHAVEVSAVAPDGTVLATLEQVETTGFFEGLLKRKPGAKATAPAPEYRLRATNAGGTWDFSDPYSFGPVLGQMDDHLGMRGGDVCHQLLGSDREDRDGTAPPCTGHGGAGIGGGGHRPGISTQKNPCLLGL